MYLIKVYQVNIGNTDIEPDYELVEQATVRDCCVDEILSIMEENNEMMEED